MARNKNFVEPRTVSGILEKDEYEALIDIGWRERKLPSRIVRDAIVEYIKNHAEGNSTFKLDKWNEDPGFQAVPTISADPQIWKKYYQDCNEADKTNLRVRVMHLIKMCRQVDINTEKKKLK